jgi:hypothetical protein
MPIIVQTKAKITYFLTEGDLYGHSLTAYAHIRKYGNELMFSLPYLSFSHSDRSTAEDVISGLKAVATWMAKSKGKSPKFGIQPWHKPENDKRGLDKYRIPVFRRSVAKEYVEIIMEEGTGYWRWNISGHVFNDDFISIVSYVGAIQKMIEIAYGTRKWTN